MRGVFSKVKPTSIQQHVIIYNSRSEERDPQADEGGIEEKTSQNFKLNLNYSIYHIGNKMHNIVWQYQEAIMFFFLFFFFLLALCILLASDF